MVSPNLVSKWSPSVSWRASQPAAAAAGSVVAVAAWAGTGTAITAAEHRAAMGTASRRAREEAIRETFRHGPRMGTGAGVATNAFAGGPGHASPGAIP